MHGAVRSLVGRLLLGITLGVWSAAGSQAGELKLSTIRIDLDDKQSSMALTVSNVGADKSLIHFRLLAWSQNESGDTLTPSKELLVNPPIAEIPAGGRQLVRIGYAGKMQQENERTYRLLVEEVPRPEAVRTRAVEAYLKISVPIFIASSTPKPLPNLTASLGAGADGSPQLIMQNTGNSHARIVGYTLAGQKRSGNFYVLPSARVALPVDPAVRRAAPKEVEIVTAEGPTTLPLRAAQ